MGGLFFLVVFRLTWSHTGFRSEASGLGLGLMHVHAGTPFASRGVQQLQLFWGVGCSGARVLCTFLLLLFSPSCFSLCYVSPCVSRSPYRPSNPWGSIIQVFVNAHSTTHSYYAFSCLGIQHQYGLMASYPYCPCDLYGPP